MAILKNSVIVSFLRFDSFFLAVKLPGPFLAGNYAESAYCGRQFKGGAVRISTENGRKIAENRMLTDVNRRYFGVDGKFSAVNRR